MDIILASTSPRRIEMMGWLGVPFKAVAADFDESSIRDANPEILTQKLSRAKAASVVNNYLGPIIIGSDSVVLFADQILEKPIDISDQRRLIFMQRGKPAEVYTSVCLINSATNQQILKTVVVPYSMSNVTDSQIDAYIRSGQGLQKAGGYGLQDLGGQFLNSISGCFPSAIGFPICQVSLALQTMGVKIEVDIKKLVKEKTGKNC